MTNSNTDSNKYHGKPCVKCGSTEKYKNGQCAQCKRAYSHDYRKNNREKAIASVYKYQCANRGKIRKQQLEYRQINRDKERERHRQYRRDNPNKKRESEQRRRARKLQAKK